MRFGYTVFCSLFVAVIVVGVGGANWPAFRGVNVSGLSNEEGIPVRWSDSENLKWKFDIPGLGGSSPVVWGDRVFVTCSTGEKAENLVRSLLCIDRKSGKLLWKRSMKAKLPENDYSAQVRQHGFTTSTPVTDGERVYVNFNRSGMLAFDMAGKELWRADLGKGVNGFGSGSSPVLVGKLVVVNATVESRHLVALDKLTGNLVWKQRLDGDCWSTPVVVDTDDKKPELVLNEQGMVFGFDPETGKKLWNCECDEPGYVSASPVTRDGIVYVMGSGINGRVCMAIRTGGKGDVTKTHVIWKQTKAGASYCSPLLVGDRVYIFSRRAVCLNAKTGAVVFDERLRGLGREYASPIAVGDKIYVSTRYGGVQVLQAGDTLKSIARNPLEDANFVASPAVSSGCLFLRSQGHLYCIAAEKSKP